MSTTTPPVRRSRRWVWFFVTLGVLAAVPPVVLIVYNLRQQLTREDLEAARQKWQQKGPRDYDLHYKVRRQTNQPETYAVEVRDGRVTRVLLDGRPLEPRLFPYHSMAAQFDNLERYLEMDTGPGKPRTFLKATFHPDDGHVQHFVRAAGRERVEMTFRLEAPAAAAASPRTGG